MARLIHTGMTVMSLILGSCGVPQDATERQLRAAKAGTLLPLTRLFPPTAETICLRGPYESLTQQPLDKAEDALDEGSWAFVITSKGGRRSHTLHHRSAALDVMTASELNGEPPVGEAAFVIEPCVFRETGVAARFKREGRQYFTLMGPRE